MHFNTSHVVVYPFSIIVPSVISKFQYISCCCLSSMLKTICNSSMHFNTSHVVVYLIPRIWFIITSVISIHLMLLFINSSLNNSVRGHYFNTSHVVVYPYKANNAHSLLTFQYISCCCLSKTHVFSPIFNLISIHLMLLFIKYS